MIRPEQMPRRERRILALGILAGLLALFVFLILVPLVDRGVTLQQSISDVSFRVDRLGQVAARLPELRQEVERLEAVVAEQRLTLDAENESLARASLQEMISDIVQRHGGDLQSTRVQAAVRDGGLRRIDLRVQMQGDSAVLAAILQEFESVQPLLFVHSLSVRAAREAAGARRLEYLGRAEIAFDVRAYWRPQRAGDSG